MNDDNTAFIDTNQFIYIYSDDEPEKKEIVQKCIDGHNCIISTQVLNEFCNVCIKKLHKSFDEINAALDELANNCMVYTIKFRDIKHAMTLQKRYGYSFFDSFMLQAALATECKYIFTEDMQNGQIIEGQLTIINIFTEN
jgi:predicted nucleic acid-binding protein